MVRADPPRQHQGADLEGERHAQDRGGQHIPHPRHPVGGQPAPRDPAHRREQDHADSGPDDEPGPFGSLIAVVERAEVHRDARLRGQGDRGPSRCRQHRQQEHPGHDQRRHHRPRLSPELTVRPGPQGIVSPGFAGRGVAARPGWSLAWGVRPCWPIKGGKPMSEFMDEAKKLAGEHSDLADQGFDQAEQFAEQKTGGHFDSQIQAGEQQAEGFLGVTDRDNQRARTIRARTIRARTIRARTTRTRISKTLRTKVRAPGSRRPQPVTLRCGPRP